MTSSSRHYIPPLAAGAGRGRDVAVSAGSPVRVAVARALFTTAVATLPVRVRFPDGRLLGDGPPGAPVMIVHRPGEFFGRLGDSGLIGFGESYMGRPDQRLHPVSPAPHGQQGPRDGVSAASRRPGRRRDRPRRLPKGKPMHTAVVIFTRDLRLHDNPALHLACSRARQVLPLFVADPAIHAPPNRARFLAESLAVLREELRARHADLVIRHGDPAAEAIKLARTFNAQAVFITDDVSRYAARRRDQLTSECRRHRLDLIVTPGLTVVPPGDLTPAGGGHYRVFTPYWRAWRAASWRPCYPAPDTIQMPAVRHAGPIPPPGHADSSGLAPGGEKAGRHRLASWRDTQMAGYGDHHGLADTHTSRLGAYLRFGCVSPLELALATRDRPGGEQFCRQLAWRDFFYQVTVQFPGIASTDYRPGPAQHLRHDQDALQAWRAGHTGIPIVDAGMRQLAAEGFMPNRARMITASFLTRNLGIHWRHGYRHFGALLADGDVACNAGNWQWVAGTGHNTRPGQVMNPLRQARRFDPAGDYVRRYVPELAGLDPARIHAPWRLDAGHRERLGYPDPLTDPQARSWAGP